MSPTTTIFLLFVLISASIQASIPFDFQLLSYTPVELSFNEDPEDEPLTKCCTETANFNFHAYGRDFPLRLQRNCAAGSQEEGTGDAQFSDGGSGWQGRLEDQPNSTVDGNIIDGLFEGIIITGDGEKFMVETQTDKNDLSGSGHSLIYRVTNRKRVMKTLFPEEGAEEVVVDEGSGQGSGEGSGIEISK